MTDFKVNWYLQNRIILEQYFGLLSLTAISSAQVQVMQMLDEGTPPVHNIVDFWEVSEADFNIFEILSFEALQGFTKHPQLGWVIFIGDRENKLTQLIGATTAQIYDFKARWYATLDEAIAFLDDIDDSLLFD